jgi:heat shock protein HtpX
MYEEIASNKRKTVLLLFGFFVLIGGLAWVLSSAFKDNTILVASSVFAVVYSLWGFFASSKLALTINGAKEIQKSDNPRLFRVVENLAITEGLPTPRIYIMNDSGMNAFATGRDPKHASVAITTGLLDVLEDAELEGVMAHELGHIKNYDIRVSMIAFALVGVVSLLCDFFLRISFWGGGMGDDSDEGGSNIMMLLAIVALVLAPIVATLMQLAISRKREYLADATGALTTRHPEGLARALEKIQAGGSTMKKQNTSTAHFFIANPLKRKSLSSLLSTHPPIEERIKILRNMSGEK